MESSAPKLATIFFQHNNHVSDKWEHYLGIYEALLESRVALGQPLNLLEIGVQNGGSLEIWSKYLPPGSLVTGIDIDAECAKLPLGPGITVHVGDASSPQALQRLLGHASFDIIVDDGSHRSPDIIASFKACFDRLNRGGIYIVEDLHASYMTSMSGGFLQDGAAVEWLKLFLDVVHLDYLDESQVAYLQSALGMDVAALAREVERVSAFDSVIAIEKAMVGKAAPYRRIMTGTNAAVSDVVHSLAKLPVSQLRSLILSPTALEGFGNRLFNELASAFEQIQLHKQAEGAVRSAWEHAEQGRLDAIKAAGSAASELQQLRARASESELQMHRKLWEASEEARRLETALREAESRSQTLEIQVEALRAQSDEVERRLSERTSEVSDAVTQQLTQEDWHVLQLAQANDQAHRSTAIKERACQQAQADEQAQQLAQTTERARQQAQADEHARQLAQADEHARQLAQANEHARQLALRLDGVLNSTTWRAGERIRSVGARLSPSTRHKIRRLALGGWRALRGLRGGKVADAGTAVTAAPALPLAVTQADPRKLVAASGLFDAEYYLETNPDVAAAGLDPLDHFLGAGGGEGRDPSEAFSSSAYFDRYPDVAAAKINPLIHYLQYGKHEGRAAVGGKAAQPLVVQLFLERFPSLRPLPVFDMASEGKRLTIVTDSVGASSLFGGVGTAIILGTLLCNRWGATLRLVTRRESPDAGAVGRVLRANGLKLRGALQVQFVPEGGDHLLGYSSDDVFMSTSWWTTRSTLDAVGPDRLFYLLQEDERMFYPHGDERLLCADVLNDPRISVIVNTHLLYNYLADRSPALPELRGRGMAFEPAFPVASAAAPVRAAGAKRNFFFYSRPHNERNLFWRGAEILSSAIETGILDPQVWAFYWVGRGTPALRLPRGVVPHRIEGLSWSEYQSLVAEMDAALVLMDTPHPSYPPLDLAAAGVAVLTNTHPGKEDLSSYSKNICMSSTEHADLLEGLARVAALGQNDVLRAANRQADGICRSWETALSDVVEHLSQRF